MNKLLNAKYGWLMVLALLIVINFLASLIHLRLDLTDHVTLARVSKKAAPRTA